MYYQANVHSLGFKKTVPIDYIRKVKWHRHCVELKGKKGSIFWPRDDVAYIATIDQRYTKSSSKMSQEEIDTIIGKIKEDME